MKNLFVLCNFLLLLLLSSCGDSDPCEDKSCSNNGTCIEGDCQCEEGYQGENCEIESRLLLIGDWYSANTTCNGTNFIPYEFTIKESDSSDEFILVWGGIEFQTTYSNGMLLVPNQDTGVGSFEATLEKVNAEDKLEFEFIIENQVQVTNCSGLASRS